MKQADAIGAKVRRFVRNDLRIYVSMLDDVDLLTRQRLQGDPELAEVAEQVVAAALKALGSPHAGGRPPKLGGSGL